MSTFDDYNKALTVADLKQQTTIVTARSILSTSLKALFSTLAKNQLDKNTAWTAYQTACNTEETTNLQIENANYTFDLACTMAAQDLASDYQTATNIYNTAIPLPALPVVSIANVPDTIVTSPITIVPSIVGGSAPLTYVVDLGDGNVLPSTPVVLPLPSLTHIYASVGTYSIKLIVTDSVNQSTTAVISVNITAVPPPPPPPPSNPIAVSLIGNTVGTTGKSISIIPTITGGISPLSMIVDFGDGIVLPSSTVVSPELPITHAYTKSGNYSLQVTVTDSLGQKSTTSVGLIISDPVVIPPTPATIQLCFGASGVVAPAGYTAILSTDPGWSGSKVNGYNFDPTPLKGSYCTANDATFTYAIPNGTYDISILSGSTKYYQPSQILTIEGLIQPAFDTGTGVFQTTNVRATITSGSLTVRIQGGGTNGVGLINALTATPVIITSSGM